MGEDEEATLRTLTSHRILIDSQIEQHHGRFVNSAGDSVLAEFASAVEAVNCAVCQHRSKSMSVGQSENASVGDTRRPPRGGLLVSLSRSLMKGLNHGYSLVL